MAELTEVSVRFLLTPLREGRPRRFPAARQRTHFYSRPCGRGDPFCEKPLAFVYDFYSRPCGRGDIKKQPGTVLKSKFLLTPLREGRQVQQGIRFRPVAFLLTPLREGRQKAKGACYMAETNFYSRPCGRGDARPLQRSTKRRNFYSRPCGRGDVDRPDSLPALFRFLLTPLREGRPHQPHQPRRHDFISTHAPAGGATSRSRCCHRSPRYFYSRPCWRGDSQTFFTSQKSVIFLLTPLREGRLGTQSQKAQDAIISTHAPAGGATGTVSFYLR